VSKAKWRRTAVTGLVALAPLALGWQLSAPGRQPEPAQAKRPRVTASRFEFEIVESFNALYLGDTPGHVGKSGGLDDVRPNVALNDAVYRGEARVGTITRLEWDRGRDSLEIEFEPEPNTRVAGGEIVWVTLNAPDA